MVKCLNPCFSGTYSQSKEDEYYCLEKTLYVLILVLVEHTLRDASQPYFVLSFAVLILVLVEHTLRGIEGCLSSLNANVLILVLVEHTLRGGRKQRNCNRI